MKTSLCFLIADMCQMFEADSLWPNITEQISEYGYIDREPGDNRDEQADRRSSGIKPEYIRFNPVDYQVETFSVSCTSDYDTMLSKIHDIVN